MSQTVRVEGLPADVTSQDIRLYFSGLEIPPGGLTIIGGPRGVAYLHFTTQSDARSAGRLSGQHLNHSKIYVYKSSIAEMERSLKNYQSPFPSRKRVYEDGKHQKRRDSSSPNTHLYLRITAGPAVGKKIFIRRCFEGLHIADIMNTSDSQAIRFGDALIKFSNSHSAYEAMRRYRDDRDITIVWSSQSEWSKCCLRKKERDPNSVKNLHNPMIKGVFHVGLTNMDYATTKEDLLKLFFHSVSENDIMILYDEKGQRLCIVTFKRREDYERVLKLNNVTCNGSPLFISSISKSRLRHLLKHKKCGGKLLHLRCFHPSVAKRDVQEFLAGFSINEEDISLLCNKDGVGIGEVVVNFPSEEVVKEAHKLHRKMFQNKRIRISRIFKKILQDFLFSKSLSIMVDPSDCVTREDDAPEEEETDDSLLDADSGFHHSDNTDVYVTQEDDEPPTPADHVDNAPTT